MIKTTLLAATFTAAFATAITAGGMVDPVIEMEPVIIEEQATQSPSSGMQLLPRYIFMLFVAVASMG